MEHASYVYRSSLLEGCSVFTHALSQSVQESLAVLIAVQVCTRQPERHSRQACGPAGDVQGVGLAEPCGRGGLSEVRARLGHSVNDCGKRITHFGYSNASESARYAL